MLAQNAPHPSFRQYTTDDGLASPEVFHILQDPEGFIWISTDNGVSRFDGYGFRNYGLKDGLRENVIFEMQLDTLGRLWMQAMSGNLYYLNGQTICPYWNNEVLLNFKNRPDTGKGFIVEGAGETVHIATLKYGILSIANDGATTSYQHKEPAYSQMFENKGKSIYALFDHGEPERVQAYKDSLHLQNLYFPVYMYINDAVWSFHDLFYASDKFYNAEAFFLGEGKYFFQMYHNLWLIEDGKVSWRHNFPFRILYAHLMQNGQLFVGLYGHQGLKIFESLETFREGAAFSCLPGKSVNYFMEDREGGKWLATHEDGVFYAPAEAIMVYDREAGLPDEKITAIATKSEKEVYIGLENGQVWSLNPETETWKKLPEIPDLGAIQSLYFDPQNQQLWAGRFNLFYWQDDQWIPRPIPKEEVPLIKANRIRGSPNYKRLWLYHYKGFMSMEPTLNQFANRYKYFDHRIFAVQEDFTGRVWIGQSNGLFEWKDGALQERQSLHPAFSLRVEDIALMPDSTLVIATKGGGVVFWKDGQFDQITTKEGLTADMLECLYADENGVLWAGTLNGLNRITGTWGQRQVEQITVFHGLPSNEINFIKTYGEDVWVATSKGLAHFLNKKKSHFFPKPILASVLANNQVLDLTKPLAMGPDKNNLTINFFAINYKMNGEIPYRYRMDSGNWTQTLNRSLNFSELSPGTRCFEVQAQNEDGIWSESTFLGFVIKPPWWSSWWARILAVVIALLAGLGVYLFRTRQLKEAHQIQLQITGLERSALQAQMNPHFIFNCLNSIQNFILQNEKEAAILYLGSFASLVRSMLNASVSGKILLVEEVKLLNNYLELEQLRFKSRFTYEVRTDGNVDVFEVEIPPLLVQPYVENALLHGISGRKTGGRVVVVFEKKEDYLEVSIEDNGTGGMPENGQTPKTKNHKSFGMSITRNRLELLSNNKEKKAVNTKTLYDANGQISGTKVIIRIALREVFIK
ncbi:MAG: hypothetical protein DHS20C18_25510 [Saprospiraceae bacterium]|nr:MAG: hypothetical protein DHS20C18_25510 [Saprospiraceae bacterium]